MLNTCFYLDSRPELRITKVTDIPRKRRRLSNKYYRLLCYLPDCSATDLKIYALVLKFGFCSLGFEGRIPNVESQCTGVLN